MATVVLHWGTIENELKGPTGMVASGMREIMRTFELAAQAATPTLHSSGHMRMSWSWEAIPSAHGPSFKLSNSADYAAARIAGVKAIKTPFKMPIGATQRYGNPIPGPSTNITLSNKRAGYDGLDIFSIAWGVTVLRERLY